MPEHSKAPAAPAAGILASLRIALVTGLIVSLGAMFSAGISIRSMLWCVVQCLVLGAVWFLLEAFRHEVAPPPNDSLPIGERVAAESTFLSAMGHDLRQPTQAIAMFSATLAAQALPDGSRKLVAGIEAGIHQLSAQLEAVFAIAKVQAGRLPCTPSVVTLNDIFEQQLALHLDDAQEAGVHLRYVGTRCKVTADPDILSRILACMLTHALQTAGEGGVVFGCRHHGSTLAIEVWTDGKGIPAEQMQQAFTPGSVFGQPYVDRGLGLVLAHRLAALTRATLSIRSPREKGRVMSLSLPKA